MVRHALDRGYEVVGVCREQSVPTLDEFQARIAVLPGATDDRNVIKQAVAGCDGVLVVLAPWGMHHYASGTAQAVLDNAPPGSAGRPSKIVDRRTRRQPAEAPRNTYANSWTRCRPEPQEQHRPGKANTLRAAGRY